MVKIVTDSLSDITSDVAQNLGITVVPLTVLFGHEAYLDRVTITTDEFYRRLVNGSVWPTTTQPTPKAFADVYDKLAGETDEILVISISSKMSGTYQSATSARNLMTKKARIEVIDSQTVAMGLGLVVLAAARKAQAGAKLNELTDFVKHALTRSHLIIYFDTLKYLAKGGRIGKASGLLGSLLSVKPIATVKDGEITPITRVRSFAAGVDHIYNSIKVFPAVESLAVEHTTNPDQAETVLERLGPIMPKNKIVRSTVSPVIGVYAGPGALAVTVLESDKK
jgi:DegV family protein with EDD domain